VVEHLPSKGKEGPEFTPQYRKRERKRKEREREGRRENSQSQVCNPWSGPTSLPKDKNQASRRVPVQLALQRGRWLGAVNSIGK
jgi:hypothetical protein